ncbi:cation/H(+) antiporter 3-like [Rutidosis leptorrhynchoides]|uniref:cation/H(+) antiporter 3-like n=1 Tax=Rutidosis leptorrhynchoides TaxID=125765 RepID=UPI003A996ADF
MATKNSSSDDVVKMFCVPLPARVTSVGIFNKDRDESLLEYALPRLETEIILIFIFGQAFQFLFKRARIPIFVFHMIAGLVVGAIMRGVIPETSYFEKQLTNKQITPPEKNAMVLGSMGALGYSFYMFLNGVKMNCGMIKKAGPPAIGVGVLSLLVPLLVLFIIEYGNFISAYSKDTIFLATTYCLTSFPVVADLLRHLKIINSELGRLALSTAIVGDLLSLFLFVGNAFMKIGIDIKNASYNDLKNNSILLPSFIAVVVFAFRPWMKWMVRNTPDGRPVKELYVNLVILAFLGTTFLAHLFGQFFLFGPFILGLAVPDGPPLGSALVDRLKTMVSGLFLPLFVASATMRVTSTHLQMAQDDTGALYIHLLIYIIMLVTKFLVTMGLSLYYKIPRPDALALAFIICSKGIVELGWYSFLSDIQLMEPQLYMAMVLLIMGIAILVPMSVGTLYDPKRKYAGYQKRTVMSSSLNSGLPIVACIHIPNNVTAVINLLDISFPTRESPISLNVLHLIKLSGQSSPTFITHLLDQNAPSTNSYSENVLFFFQQFERKHWGGIALSAFTSISPEDAMDEDICMLALDKLASLIILPFHRRWYINGTVESEDHSIMELNWSVFETAPCSVGVLVDRGHIRSQNSIGSSEETMHNILLVFLGGADDREALTFAKRMLNDKRVKLTVLHIHTAMHGDADSANWERMLDMEVLKDVKNCAFVEYKEEKVNDGHIIASMLRDMVNDYELIIVGRRFGVDCPQTSGLKEWSEFPELGILGDLLASTDFYGISSVLIIQQQLTSQNIR